jgi:hypothetical protein
MADLYQYVLKAGVATQAAVQGKMILVDEIIGADGVDITPMLNNSTGRTMKGRKKAFKCWVDYDAVILQSDTDCTVLVWLAKSDVSLGFADGALVNVVGGVSIINDQGSRVPVDLAGGTVTVTADNVGVSNDDTKPVPIRRQALKNLVHVAPVAVNTGAAVQLYGDAATRVIVFRNTGSTVIGLGGAGVTAANAAILLNPGDTWVEDNAPGIAWYAASAANGGQVSVMGMKP